MSEEERLNDILKKIDALKGMQVPFPMRMEETLEFMASEGLIKIKFENDYTDKPTCWAAILPKGTIFLKNGGFIKQSNDKADIEKLSKEKLMIDITNAENIYKSYRTTQKIAITGLAISIILLLLKLAEALRFWPYN